MRSSPGQVRLRLERPHQPHRHRRPWRVGDHALASAGARREEVELAFLAPDQPTEQEASGRTRDEYVAIERLAEVVGVEPFAPDFVARAIVADTGRDGHRNLASNDARGNDQGRPLRGSRAVRTEDRDDW